MKLENISNGKIIGIGEVTVLPGETKDIPEAYETSPILGGVQEEWVCQDHWQAQIC